MSSALSVPTRPRSASLPVAAVLLGAAVGVAGGLARPGPFELALVALPLLPLGALALAGAARAAVVTAALVYGGVLVWCYVAYFAPQYGYQGLVDEHAEPAATLVVVAVAALPACWLPMSGERPSSVVLWLVYLTGYVPAVIVPILLTGNLERVLPLDLALLAALAITVAIVHLPAAPLELPHLSAPVFTWLLIGLSLASSAYIAAEFGLRSLPSLGDVYTSRRQFDAALGGAAAGAYIVPWTANVFNPLLMALGMARRRFGLLALGLAGQLLVYADTGFKSVLFSIALVPLVYAALAVTRRIFGLVAILSAPAILAGGVLANSLSGDWSLGLVRRFFATPGQVGWYFYDYFDAHPHYHLSHSFLGWLTSSGYVEDPPQLIGRVYFPDELPSANAHLWADAFANFGFAGILVFTAILGVFLLVVDGLARDRDPRVYGPMLAIAGVSLASSALFTTMLTLGLGVGCLLMAMMPRVSD